jgi:two-component system sensor histidine kinase YesM
VTRRLVPFRRRLVLSLGLFVLLVLLLTGALLTAYRGLSVTMLNRAYSQTLTMLSMTVEDGLRSVRELAVRIATNPDLQERVEALSLETDTYERSVRSSEIVSRMISGSPPPYLAAMYIVDSTGAVTANRLDYPELGAIVSQTTLESFRRSSDPYRWVYTATNPEVFLLLRRMRKVAELSLRELGYLVLVVDKDRFVRSVFRRRFVPDLDVGILHNDRLVYSTNTSLNASMIAAGLADQGHGSVRVGPERYFTTAIGAVTSDLRYVCMVPNDLLFGPLASYNRIALVAYAVLLVALLVSAGRVATSISSPVVHLAGEMKKIENEDFSKVSLHHPARIRSQEVGTLYREFQVMLRRIDDLINENYRKQILVQDARFRSLQAQINPHFLYNTLESINWLAQLNDQEVIASMVQALGDLLRASIGGKRPVIPLAEEVELLRQYVLIQKLRYGERLEVLIEIPENLGEIAVPKLALQPFVENSIKYGLETSDGVCRVQLRVEEREEMITISIQDNGPGMEQSLVQRIEAGEIEPRGSGVGIKNIRDRLHEIYGADCALSIDSQPGRGVIVTLTLPGLTVQQLSLISGVER